MTPEETAKKIVDELDYGWEIFSYKGGELDDAREELELGIAKAIAEATDPTTDPEPVKVTASDYAYEGWLVGMLKKRKSGALRYVVEDDNGRLFIHNGKQIATSIRNRGSE